MGRKSGKLHFSNDLNKKLNEKKTMADIVASIDDEPSDFRIAWHYPIRVIVFFVVLFFGCLISLMLPLRPHYSHMEQRELTKFPKFSFAALVDGDYFDDINTWFADTFPGREGWVDLNAKWSALHGFGSGKLYGPVDPGDEIPDVSFEEPSLPEVTTAATMQTTVPTTTTSTAPSTTATTVATTKPTAAPTNPPTKKTSSRDLNDFQQGVDVDCQNLNGILVRGNTAYEYYSFSTSAANLYVGAVNKVAGQVSGKAKVYDIVIPTSIGVMLNEKVRNSISSSDQEKAINYIYGTMSGSVGKVPLLGTLREHNNEYLYFHSDHHWTATGAYYAYSNLMQMMGKAPEALGGFERKEFGGFKGSFYSETNDANLQIDTVVAYLPHADTSMFFEDSDGARTDWHVIQDVSSWAARSKYNTFIGGDNAFTEITNNGLHDGSACVVIKESFGNALVPFLVDHYQKVYVLDYRYYTKMKLSTFVDAYHVQDVIFANNIGATRSTKLMEKVAALVG